MPVDRLGLEPGFRIDHAELARIRRDQRMLLDLLEHGSREYAAAYLRRHLDVARAIKVAAGASRDGACRAGAAVSGRTTVRCPSGFRATRAAIFFPPP